MNLRVLISVILTLSISSYTNAQSNDSLTVNKKHSVKLATLLSTGLPGAGQVYNHIGMPKGKKKAYWKVPLIYAGLGATTYLLISHQSNMNLYRREYLGRIEQELAPGQFIDPATASYDNQALLTLQEDYQGKRDMMILATAGIYIINILDAAVEAHFVEFDISDDLTMSLRPRIMMGYSPGLSLRFNFR